MCWLAGLDADKFARAVFSAVNEVCERWKTELPVLPPPQPQHDTSVHAVRNRRRKMEDKHVVMHDLNALFGLKVKWKVSSLKFPPTFIQTEGE